MLLRLGKLELQEDQMALDAILHVVSPEMIATLVLKENTKEAWEMRVGVE